MIRKITCVCLVIAFLTVVAPAAIAQDKPKGMGRIFTSTIYGGAIGAITGLAFLALSDKPGDHLAYIPTWAAVGVLGGLTYGIATTSGRIALAEVENGRVTINPPVIRTDIIKDRMSDTTEVVSTLDIIGYRF